MQKNRSGKCRRGKYVDARRKNRRALQCSKSGRKLHGLGGQRSFSDLEGVMYGQRDDYCSGLRRAV